MYTTSVGHVWYMYSACPHAAHLDHFTSLDVSTLPFVLGTLLMQVRGVARSDDTQKHLINVPSLIRRVLG